MFSLDSTLYMVYSTFNNVNNQSTCSRIFYLLFRTSTGDGKFTLRKTVKLQSVKYD